MVSKMKYDKIESLELSERASYIVYGIFDLLQMACDEGMDWVETPDIIDYLGTDYGGHVTMILNTLVFSGMICGMSVRRMSDGKRVSVWALKPEIPF